MIDSKRNSQEKERRAYSTQAHTVMTNQSMETFEELAKSIEW